MPYNHYHWGRVPIPALNTPLCLFLFEAEVLVREGLLRPALHDPSYSEYVFSPGGDSGAVFFERKTPYYETR